MTNNMFFCCDDMKIHISENEVAIRYSPRDREFHICVLGLKAPTVSEVIQSYQLINYCPWCGSKLPDHLGERRCRELEKLGYDEFFSDDIPSEFKTDEWWLKRGY
ncbi:MAG: hypothetical protein HRT87_01540 [Legionellales bacterium]|nr:hypothetical protein [Legionellales bacterium]